MTQKLREEKKSVIFYYKYHFQYWYIKSQQCFHIASVKEVQYLKFHMRYVK